MNHEFIRGYIVEVLISRFVTDAAMDLGLFAGESLQLAFFKRTVFRNFDHLKFKQRLDNEGISVRSFHAPAADVYHQANDEFMTMLKIIKSVYGVRTITLHPQRGEKQQAKQYYKKLEAKIYELDIILAYETFEEGDIARKWISQLKEMSDYFDILKFPFLGITYDFAHSSFEKCCHEVPEYQSKIHVIHFSDALRDKPLDPNEYHQHLPLGYGNYRICDFLDMLLSINYQHFLVLEYYPRYDELLKRDAHAVRQYLQGNKIPLQKMIEKRRSVSKHETGAAEFIL